MIGCLRTRVLKQPIIALYFESEPVFKFYNLEACIMKVTGAQSRPGRSACSNSMPISILSIKILETIFNGFFTIKWYGDLPRTILPSQWSSTWNMEFNWSCVFWGAICKAASIHVSCHLAFRSSELNANSVPFNGYNGVARMLKKLRTSKGAYWIKQ